MFVCLFVRFHFCCKTLKPYFVVLVQLFTFSPKIVSERKNGACSPPNCGFLIRAMQQHDPQKQAEALGKEPFCESWASVFRPEKAPTPILYSCRGQRNSCYWQERAIAINLWVLFLHVEWQMKYMYVFRPQGEGFTCKLIPKCLSVTVYILISTENTVIYSWVRFFFVCLSSGDEIRNCKSVGVSRFSKSAIQFDF